MHLVHHGTGAHGHGEQQGMGGSRGVLGQSTGGKGGGDGVEDNKVLVKNVMLVDIKHPFLKECFNLCCLMGKLAWWPGKPELGLDTVEQVLVMMLQSKVVCHFLDEKGCLDLGLKTICNKTTDDRPRYILGPS